MADRDKLDTSRFEAVIDSIDAENQQDPNQEEHAGRSYPREYLYSLRMSDTLRRFDATASEELKIAARAQHIRRWTIERAAYPENRAGYLKWRRDLGRFHAEETARLMEDAGYPEAQIATVKALLMKKDLKQNPETQTLEDVICLVFLQYYLDDFARKHDDGKLISIVGKTWKKMSERGQQAALQLNLPGHLSSLIERALNKI